jgi:hypothetical protein
MVRESQLILAVWQPHDGAGVVQAACPKPGFPVILVARYQQTGVSGF